MRANASLSLSASTDPDKMDRKEEEQYEALYKEICHFLSALAEPIEWEQAPDNKKDGPPKMNVMVIGEIGNGKSTLMNKFG